MKVVILVGLGLVAGLLIAGGVWAYTPDLSKAQLERKYLTSPGDYLDISGIRLHVRLSGPVGAPAIVLLHGFGSSLLTWDAWAKVMSRDHRVIRYDLPGFGLTGPDPTGDYSDARAVDILAALLDHEGIARASIVGNSLGGRIAWQFAARRPDRVVTLVLISPDGFASQGFEYGRAPQVPFLLRLLPWALPSAMVRMNLAPAYADQSVLTDDLVAQYRDMLRAPGVRDAVVVRMAQTVLEPPEPILRRIAAPTLLLWGDRDAMIPPSNAADYLKDLKDVRLSLLAGVGHLPQEEAPAKALQPVMAFLADHEGGGRAL
jgi:pimeloyl-ACP methyl ester carboxylesterase